MSVENELQNEFLNQLRKSATPVSVFLTNGDRLDGRIRSFDIYSISLDGPEAPRLIVKTVIATIQPANKAARANGKPAPRVQMKPSAPRTERREPEITRKKRRVVVPHG
jgi:host factor-I protein